MLDRAEKELVQLVLVRLNADKDVGYSGVDINMQLWLINKLVELDSELTSIQADKTDALVITDAKMRLMKEFGMSESKAYKLIGRKAMTERTTKLAIAEEILRKQSLEGYRDVT